MARPWPIRTLLIIVALLLLYVAGLIVRGWRGARVVIRNNSGQTLHHVAVKVGSVGKRYELADIEPGRTSRIFVQPRADYSVNLEYQDAIGRTHVATVIGYAQQGEQYCPSGEATILPSGEIEARDHTTFSLCWRSWLDFVS